VLHVCLTDGQGRAGQQLQTGQGRAGRPGQGRAAGAGQARQKDLGNFRIWFSGHGFQDLGSQFWDLDFTQGASQWPSAMGTH
jgi:hypothetical protein